MRLKTSGRDGEGRSAGGGGGGGSRCADSALVAPVAAEADEGTGPGLLPPPPPLAGVRMVLLPPPPPVGCGPSPPGSPRLARLGIWRFAGLGSSGPRAEEGRVPSILGGAVHRRVAGGSEPGRAEAGQARPRAPGFRDEYLASRRYAGRGPWAAVACRGAGVAFVARPVAAVDAPAQAPAPGARWRPMFQAECALHALPAPGGRLRCGAARGALRAGARGGLRAHGSRGGPPSRGRGK